MTIIFRDVDLDDFVLAFRAVRYLLNEPKDRQDAIMAYGEPPDTKDFYVRRNKASITVRPCYRAQQ